MPVQACIPFFQRAHPQIEAHAADLSPATRTEIVSVTVEDIRGHESFLNFELDGMEVLKLTTSLSRDDFNATNKVEQQYCSEMAAAILERLEADTVQIFDAQGGPKPRPRISTICNQHDQYAAALRPHIDTTYDQALAMISTLRADSEQLLKGRWVLVNAWKPLRGPLRDWPLMLCRPESMADGDVLRNQITTNGQHNENMLLYHSPLQKWVYLSDQQDDEVWLFRQASSDAHIGVPHCSFPLPLGDAEGRESIEIRAFVYF